MDMSNLPVIKNKKKINIKKFVDLAQKVKRSFEIEEAYLKKQNKIYGNSYSGKLLPYT